MHVHQLSIRHIAEQDRLLVRLNTADGEEYRLWLTRRMLAILQPHLKKLLSNSGQGAADLPQDEAGKQMLSEFRQEAVLQQSDFATPFNPQPAALPLGPEPLLVTHAQFAAAAGGALDIMFEEILPGQVTPRGLTVHLEYPLLVGMMRLLDNALEPADWALPEAGRPAPSGSPAAEPDPQRPKYVN